MNNPDFKEPGSGHDPILGQNNTPGENRQRKFKLTFKTQDGSDRTTEVCLDADWVIPTGGGYFFSPSIEALNLFSKTQSTAHQELTPEEYTAAFEENIPDRD